MGSRAFSRALIGTGLAALILSLGVLGLARWVEWRHGLEAPAGPGEMLPEQLGVAGLSRSRLVVVPPAGVTGRAPDLVPTSLPAAPTVSPSPTVAVAASATPTRPPTPTPPPSYGIPTWIVIPRMRLDTSVMQVGVQDDAYVVPSWDVGHHEDSANPGEPGNSIYNGHLETINAGHPFARLKDLRPGDAVYVYTRTHRVDWVVTDAYLVPNTDSTFLEPTVEPRLTLYTCAGTWNPREQDYSHRLVVVGRLVSVSAKK